MGFFGFGNYSKPGPGVSKDEPEKKGFFLFFEIYFRKFWKLCEANLLFSACCVPFFIPFFVAVYFQVQSNVVLFITLLPLVGIIPMVSGLTIILRNFARQQHAFIWMDFRDTVKSNWKQSLIMGVIDFVVYYVLIVCLMFYYQQLSAKSFFVIPFVISIFAIVVFTFMQYYIYVMIITFELTLKQILKNAMIFAFAGLGHNLLITLILGIIALLCYISPLAIILLPVIGISTAGFVITFNVWPTIKKYMIHDDPADKVEDPDEQVFEDTVGKNDDKSDND